MIKTGLAEKRYGDKEEIRLNTKKQYELNKRRALTRKQNEINKEI